MEITLTWNIEAFSQFEDAVSFIEEDSLANSEKFKIEVSKKL